MAHCLSSIVNLLAVNRFILLIIFLFGLQSLSGQEIQLPISTVRFEGLKKTDEGYLQHFLSSRRGEVFSLKKLKKDEQRLKNLAGINNVVCQRDTTESGINILFEVEEAYTIFPIVNFGRITDNFWYKFGFTEVNWMGKGIHLSAFYQNIDKRHNFNFFIKIPYMNGSRWGSSISLTKYASIEPLYFDEGPVVYKYDNYSAYLIATRELSYGHTFDFGITYFVEKYEKANSQSLENPPGPDALSQPKFMAKFGHKIDRINHHYFYQWGFDNQTSFETVYNLDETNYFLLFFNDTRYFKRIGKKGNLAMRFRLGVSTNRATPFAPFVVSSHVNIRGVGNRINRGTATLVLNTEYRQTLLENKIFAVQAVAFSDMGTWRKPGGDFGDFTDKDIFRHFVGGGVRLIYKKAYNAIFRLDYGVDIYDKNIHGMVLGLGQYF